MNKIQLSISICFATIIYLTCNAPKVSSEEHLPGQTLYAEYCSGCHGVKMEAFVNWKWKYGSEDNEIRNSIVEGRGEGAMPAYGAALSDKQISDLVAYLRHGFENLEKYDFEKSKTDINQVFEAKDFKYKLQPIVRDLKSPWGMAFFQNGDMLVTDKIGKLFLINSLGKKQEIKNVPEVNDGGQGGLMDVQIHPDYANNGWLYLSYSKRKSINGKKLNTTAVARYRLEENELVDMKLIFEGLPYSKTRHHYGSRLEFDNEGYLYITIGDRGSRDVNPQRLDLFPGKIHRLNDDGSIPTDNPFYEEKDAIKSIFSYGHRNPQGLAKHPVTGELWSHEHGPRGGDEINILKKGANYGWPIVSYGINYIGTVFTKLTEKEGMESPVHYWVPSIAPCGMDFVTSDHYPGWKNQLLVGSLKFEYLNLCKLDGQKIVSEELLMKGLGRVRNVKQSTDGYIYVALEKPGIIYKLMPINI